MRESEIKHGRLAMLAAVGWVWAEMFTPFSFALMETNGRAPSLFNGGLFSFPTSIGFLLMMGIFAGAETAVKAGPNGDLGFDPLNVKQAVTLSQNEELKAAEIRNGRLAMLAITGYAVQEFFWGVPVVKQTGFFFLNF